LLRWRIGTDALLRAPGSPIRALMTYSKSIGQRCLPLSDVFAPAETRVDEKMPSVAQHARHFGEDVPGVRASGRRDYGWAPSKVNFGSASCYKVGRMPRSAAIVSAAFARAACAVALSIFSSCARWKTCVRDPSGLTTATVVRRRRCRRRRCQARNRRGPQAASQPMAGCVTKLGSSLLTRTGADARIISTVDTDGFE
jgi:hypothetical protein